MSGNKSVISILAIGVTLLVAISYAQESSRRSSVYRVDSEEPALLSAADGPTLLPPKPISGGSMYQGTEEQPAEETQVQPSLNRYAEISQAGAAPGSGSARTAPAKGSRREMAAEMGSSRRGAVQDSEVAPASDAEVVGAPPVRSVLKKTKPTQVQQVQPPTLPPAPAPGEEIQLGPQSEPGEIRLDEPAPSTSNRRNPTERGKRLAAEEGTEERTNLSIHDLQLVSHNPQLQVEVNGPQSITVGQPAKYIVYINNIGDLTASDVMVRLALPTWVTARITDASQGDAQIQPDAQGIPRLMWSVPSCATKSRQQLRFELIAAEGQPFDLSAEWVCKPTTVQGQVTVLQPQLDLVLSGPAEMNFGEEKLFTLTVSNAGNGDAANVNISMSAGSAATKQIEVGNLAAGKKKDIPVQVVANENGEMLIRAVATGEGDLKSEASARLKVRRPQLAVVVEGNELQFAGSEVDFTVVVTNQGDAIAEDVTVSATLPEGARYVGGIEGATATGNLLKWRVPSLAAAAEKVYDVRMILQTEGANKLAVEASSANGASGTGEWITEVQAVSDLKLVVNDPSGPNPTNSEISYELTVMNRGTRAAHDVRIVMQFSEGIEPIALEGGEGKLVPGQVVCEPLAELGPGEQVSLLVKAKADKAGTLIYRVEVTQAEDEDRLVEEGTTKFFADSGRATGTRTAKRPAATTGEETKTR